MGGSSGIRILDDLNPANSQGAVGHVVSDVGNSINHSFDSDQGRLALGAAAIIGTAGALGAFTPAVAAAETGVGAVGSTGYLGAAVGESAASTGIGYLGTETVLSGTGTAAAELGGIGASSSSAIGYAGSYLGAETGITSSGASAGFASLPWYENLIPTGATAIGLANTFVNASRPSGSPGSISSPASSVPAGTIGRGYSSAPSSPGSTISIGGQGSATPQSAAAVKSSVAMGLGVAALLYLASKKRLV